MRGGSFAVLETPGLESVSTGARVFGARVLRSDNVGIQRPISLSVPVAAIRAAQEELYAADEDAIVQTPAPDFAEIEEAARLQGYNEGYEQGLAAGIAAAEGQMALVLEQLQMLVANVHESHAGFFRAAERQVVDLAIQIAQKVIERE